MLSKPLRHFATTSFLCLLFPALSVGEKIDFNRQIRPILTAKCFQCHGPDEENRAAELRLDSADSADGPFSVRDGSQAIKPGDLEASLVWQRIVTTDVDERMPPSDSHIEPLTAEQLELFKNWILDGANYQQYWAFAPPVKPNAPNIADSEWNKSRIDRFVMKKLEGKGLSPNSQASKRTLIRRLTFDLTGLPPTKQEIHAFLNDTSNHAYEDLVDRLLDSPHYGEHMAKYWLDLVRFADTNGIHHDHYREMTPYRDWVIRSFNDNLPFDDFVVYQIAGDLYENPSIDQQIASGFNRLHLVIDKGTAIPQESFTRNVIDRVTAVGTAFMGLTVGCAVCHDHKYDPITRKDFYQLYAFFNNIDSGPETPGRGIHAPFIRLPNDDQKRQLQTLEGKIAASSKKLNELKAQRDDTAKGSGSEDPTDFEALQKAAQDELNDLKKAKKQLEAEIPVTLVMKERKEVRPTHMLIRGAYDQLGEEVERGTPAFLPPLKSEGPVKTRMDLARWLTDGTHPLTARVTVNRFWQQFFGVGLVKTSEDFGTQGEWPSHPLLLEDLTVSFVESNWDVKNLVKSFVMSQTYRQSSKADPAAFKSDPENRLLSRGSRFRMDAEMIRDQILATSGLLNPTMFGKSVKPPQPPNLWKTVSMVSSSTYAFSADKGDKIYRRSVYSFWKRALPPPQMTIFDAPTRESCTARRERTNTPLQALVLMNEGQYFKAARHFAQKILEDKNMSATERLTHIYETVTSHLPDNEELATLSDGLQTLRTVYQSDADLTRELTAEVENVDDSVRVEIAAYTMLINSVFNLDVTKTRE